MMESIVYRRLVACLGLGLLLTIIFAPAACAQQITDRSNAAYWYQRAMADMEEAREIEREFEVADFDAYYAFVEGTTDQVPAIVRRYMRKLPKVFDSMHKAARRDAADYRFDYRQGPGLMLPHLGALRSITGEMNYDAQMRIDKADARGAAKNLATIIKTSDHLADDRLAISSLVGVAVFTMADATIKQGFDNGVFDAADAATLLRSMRDMPDADPFGHTEAIAMEHEVMVGWLAGFAEDARQNEQLRAALDWSMDDDERAAFFESLDAFGYGAALDQFDRAMARVVAAFTTEDRAKGREMMASLDRDIEDGQYGPLVHAFMMSYDRIFDQMVRGEEMFAKRKAMLEEIVGGALDVDDLRNAAKLYLKAIEQYALLSEQDREAIAHAYLDPAAVDDAERMVAIEAADAVVGTIREAAALGRCDFVELKRWTPELNLVPAYVHGLNELWRLLHVRAAYSLDTDDIDAASESVVFALRMARHMEHAGPMPRSMLAHHWFRETVALIEPLLEHPALLHDHRQAMARALEDISRRDPFGYAATHTYTRERDTSMFGHIWRNGPEWQERVEAFNALLDQEWDGQRTLYFAAMDELFPADIRHGEIDRSGDDAKADPFVDLRELADAAGCPDLFDADAAAAIINDHERFAEAIAAGDATVFIERPDPPQIAAIARWKAQARLDLRRASAMLPVMHSDRIDDR